MWRLLRELQEVAFPELDKQDLLAELCKALLRCSQWTLAQRYLTGTGSTPMHATRAEKLVLQIGVRLAPTLPASLQQHLQFMAGSGSCGCDVINGPCL